MLVSIFCFTPIFTCFHMFQRFQSIKNKPERKLRILLSFFLLLLILSFLLAKIIPGGEMVYRRDYSRNFFALGGQGFLSLLSPADRIDSTSSSYPRLLADPIYFSLFTPRSFDRVRLLVRYQDELSDKTPIIEAGLLKDKTVWRYQIKPIENKILDSLNWSKLRQGALVLYQRLGETEKLDNFLQNAASRNDLALYNYSLNKPFNLASYQPRQSSQVVASALRGPYQFYTYLDHESLNFNFYFQDLNQNYDLKGDGVSVVVSDLAGKEIFSRDLPDDGEITDNGNLGPEKTFSLFLKDLPRGVYRVDVKTNDDLVTKKIVSTQSKLSFINKIWLEDKGSKALEVYTNSDYVRATAFGATGLQTLFFQAKAFEIDAPFQQFNFQIKNSKESSPYLLSVKPQALILENNGVFAFSPEALVDPSFLKIDNNWQDKSDINYILAEYETPQESGQDKLAILEFDLSDAYREKGKYGFMISIPGLYADNQNRAALGLEPSYLQIKEIKAELSGKSLGEKIKETFQRLYSKGD